ncbi:ceramide-1-phosphate transfer protein [Callorhinchus milii]|uniref:ceramide-1-phosphate transfer protein n=1 Tax=Callorhinchus milii TaxID=7868 RepID=UPI001C3FD03D|nr:ceramide-1-phosphate transfer protein [Callorhinchus milii]
MAETQRFSLTEVLDSFRTCLTDQGDILLEHYLNGWKGLIKFMNSLGSVFSFISKDAVGKIQIMENYRIGEFSQQYLTLQSMVKYEMENKLVDLVQRSENWDSGCRTILRLHRVLRWLQLFLEKLQIASEDSKTSVLCTEAYNDSLACHHTWIVRKAATVAFYALPTRVAFFEAMNMGTTEEAVAKLGVALPFLSKVFDITEELYKQHNLLDLP